MSVAPSAGYGAVRELLKKPEYVDRIDSLLLADSLYASFTSAEDPSPHDEQMAGFRAFARAASRGEKIMTVTYSQVQTHTYANTAQTADDLMQHVGLQSQATDIDGLGELRLIRHAQWGNFKVWGAAGDDADAHMAHLRYIAQWLRDLRLRVDD